MLIIWTDWPHSTFTRIIYSLISLRIFARVHPGLTLLLRTVYWGCPLIPSRVRKVVLHSQGVSFRWSTGAILVLKCGGLDSILLLILCLIRLCIMYTPPVTLIGWGLSFSIVCSRGVNILQASASSSLLTKCIWEPTKASKISLSYASGSRASRYLYVTFITNR